MRQAEIGDVAPESVASHVRRNQEQSLQAVHHIVVAAQLCLKCGARIGDDSAEFRLRRAFDLQFGESPGEAGNDQSGREHEPTDRYLGKRLE